MMCVGIDCKTNLVLPERDKSVFRTWSIQLQSKAMQPTTRCCLMWHHWGKDLSFDRSARERIIQIHLSIQWSILNDFIRCAEDQSVTDFFLSNVKKWTGRTVGKNERWKCRDDRLCWLLEFCDVYVECPPRQMRNVLVGSLEKVSPFPKSNQTRWEWTRITSGTSIFIMVAVDKWIVSASFLASLIQSNEMIKIEIIQWSRLSITLQSIFFPLR